MNTSEFFEHLWNDYIKITPQAQAIRQLFEQQGETVINDHVAFRTFGSSPINLAKLEPVLAGMGYRPYGQFRFEQKKLKAKCFKHESEPDAPKIFLSELLIEELSPEAQAVIARIIEQIPADLPLDPSIFWRGPLWDAPTRQAYDTLVNESEYAAWLATIGVRVNHFTVSINRLKQFTDIEAVNALLKKNGFAMNSVGGEIKGSPELLLEQSSTMADRIEFTFKDGETASLPSCFYEFTKRYEVQPGVLFDRFIEGNADKIFESTYSR